MRPFVYESPPLMGEPDTITLAEFLARQFRKVEQSISSVETGDSGSGVVTYGALIPGTGNVEDDLNATDFTGEEYAGVDGCAATALSIKTNAVVTFGHNNVAYNWIGPGGVCVGLGGNYTALATDLAAIGTADHAILVNRNQADQHAQSAITDLVLDQGTQDTRIASLESSDAIQDGRLDTLEQHPPLTDNPHQVRHDQLPDVDPNPEDPHPQYKREQPSILMYGSCDNFGMTTGGNVLQNYTDTGYWGGASPSDFNPITGTITIPQSGVWQIIVFLTGQQGNDNKEESMFLEVGFDGGWEIASVFDVATDKTDWRSFALTATRGLPAGTVLQLRGRATAGLGTFNVDNVTFEVHKQRDL